MIAHYLLSVLSLRDAGLVLLVLCALRAILLPSLALVLFKANLALMLGAAKHWAAVATILPLRMPDVHLYFLTVLAPRLPQICFSSRELNSSFNNIFLFNHINQSGNE